MRGQSYMAHQGQKYRTMRGYMPQPVNEKWGRCPNMWEIIGPSLLAALKDGINAGFLYPEITLGLIILLHKKGDIKFLTNKRGLTLLNTAYKILTKLFQLRLVPILHKFISSQQAAFLLGQSLHHSMLLINKLIHQAKKGITPHIVAKLDVIKAFNLLDWEFLFSLLYSLGFGPCFSRFIKAITTPANSKIYLNGRSIDAIQIRHSVCQGCPISPLLFIIAMEALCQMVITVEAQGQIRGFYWEELNIKSTISIYVDDVTLFLLG